MQGGCSAVQGACIAATQSMKHQQQQQLQRRQQRQSTVVSLDCTPHVDPVDPGPWIFARRTWNPRWRCRCVVPSLTTLATMRRQSTLSSESLMSFVGLTLFFHDAHKLPTYFSLRRPLLFSLSFQSSPSSRDPCLLLT